jgi:hypothetical protein
MEWRGLVLFIANDQRAYYTNMGHSKRPTNTSHKSGMKRSSVVYSKWPTNELHKYGM